MIKRAAGMPVARVIRPSVLNVQAMPVFWIRASTMKLMTAPPSPPPVHVASGGLSKKDKKKALQKAMNSGQKLSKKELKECYNYHVRQPYLLLCVLAYRE